MFANIFRRIMGKRENRTLEAGKTAPPFALGATDGQKRSLTEALSRGPLLAAFFKISCPTCQYTFPFIERLYQQLRSAGAPDVQIWGIVQDSASLGRRFAQEYGVTFPILVDDEPYETSREYGLNYVPTLFLINPDARVEITCDGFAKADLIAIHTWLASHFAVKPPALFRPADGVPEFKPG
jgi:peroxiredoxin